MNEIIVKIKWDQPSDPFWLNPDNVNLALEAYCPNTKFKVTNVVIIFPDREMKKDEFEGSYLEGHCRNTWGRTTQ